MATESVHAHTSTSTFETYSKARVEREARRVADLHREQDANHHARGFESLLDCALAEFDHWRFSDPGALPPWCHGVEGWRVVFVAAYLCALCVMRPAVLN